MAKIIKGACMKTIFAYGTLKRGYYWNHLLKDQKYLWDRIISGYKLVHFNGNGTFYVPVMLKSKPSDEVYGELWEVSDSCFNKLLDLERGYSCVDIGDNVLAFVADENASIYECAKSLPEIPKVAGVYNYTNV
jgi:gamma-glutamylcyclotransferase (GGCT)/AIG2-like uncharacterized protein YtfP